MTEQHEQTNWSAWFSTYGMLTTQRILERFDIHLTHDALMKAAKDPHDPYHQMLRVPLKNVFNGIILQQAHDYQQYAQKLFVDYLLSGLDAQEKDAPGAMVREDLEQQRLHLMTLVDAFKQLEYEHQVLIATSQASITAMPRDLNAAAIAEGLADYIEQADAINISLRHQRSQFYDCILRVTELLTLLPDYQMDDAKVAENREHLAFDAMIGEEES